MEVNVLRSKIKISKPLLEKEMSKSSKSQSVKDKIGRASYLLHSKVSM